MHQLWPFCHTSWKYVVASWTTAMVCRTPKKYKTCMNILYCMSNIFSFKGFIGIPSVYPLTGEAGQVWHCSSHRALTLGNSPKPSIIRHLCVCVCVSPLSQAVKADRSPYEHFAEALPIPGSSASRSRCYSNWKAGQPTNPSYLPNSKFSHFQFFLSH